MAPVPGPSVFKADPGRDNTPVLQAPDFVTHYVSVLLLASAVLACCIFIEMMAFLTRKTMEQMATFLFSRPESRSARAPEPTQNRYPLLPYVVAHILLDEMCPIISHTPAELPKEDSNGKVRVLPERISSPCGICSDGICMGEMRRTLPCAHSFHARCIDNMCIVKSFWNKWNDGGSIKCPSCPFVLVPTPALLGECLSVSLCSSISDQSM